MNTKPQPTNELKLKLWEKGYTIKSTTEHLGMSAYQGGQKILNINRLKYNDLKILKDILEISYNELFKILKKCET